jgi:hypothetical protein
MIADQRNRVFSIHGRARRSEVNDIPLRRPAALCPCDRQ